MLLPANISLSGGRDLELSVSGQRRVDLKVYSFEQVPQYIFELAIELVHDLAIDKQEVSS